MPPPRILPGPRFPLSVAASLPRVGARLRRVRLPRGRGSTTCCPSLPLVLFSASHLSTFPPAFGRFAPLHCHRNSPSSVICTPYPVLFSASASHLYTFAPAIGRFAPLHLPAPSQPYSSQPVPSRAQLAPLQLSPRFLPLLANCEYVRPWFSPITAGLRSMFRMRATMLKSSGCRSRLPASG